MNKHKFKKALSVITFTGMLFLNVPVYASVTPAPTDNVIQTTNEQTQDTQATTTDATTGTETQANETTTTTNDDQVQADQTTSSDEATDDAATTDEVTADESTTTTEAQTEESTEVTTEEEQTQADQTATTDEATDDEEQADEEVDAGITPDSALYTLDRLLEKIQITFTFDDVNKAALLSSISEERLAEVNYLIEKANTEEVDQEEWNKLIEGVIGDYKEMLESALESIEEVAVDLNDDEKEQLDELIVKIEKSAAVTDEVAENDEEVQEVSDRAILVANVVKNLDKEKVTEIRDQGLGLGEIAQIFALADAAGVEVDEVAKLYIEDGLGFGEAAKTLGVHPSEVAKKKVEEKKKNKKHKKGIELEDADEEIVVDDASDMNPDEINLEDIDFEALGIDTENLNLEDLTEEQILQLKQEYIKQLQEAQAKTEQEIEDVQTKSQEKITKIERKSEKKQNEVQEKLQEKADEMKKKNEEKKLEAQKKGQEKKEEARNKTNDKSKKNNSNKKGNNDSDEVNED